MAEVAKHISCVVLVCVELVSLCFCVVLRDGDSGGDGHDDACGDCGRVGGDCGAVRDEQFCVCLRLLAAARHVINRRRGGLIAEGLTA